MYKGISQESRRQIEDKKKSTEGNEKEDGQAHMEAALDKRAEHDCWLVKFEKD